MKKILVALLVILGVAVSMAYANETYHFGVNPARTNITFESKTDFEDILGSTNQLTGHVSGDWEAQSGEIQLTVPVASLRTGIDSRDEHLRSEKWMDEAKHKNITFLSESFEKVDESTWKVTGKFTMKGVEKDLVTTVTVKRIPEDVARKAGLGAGSWIKVDTTFKVKLSEFGVEVPDKAQMKVDDVWTVTVSAFATTAGE